MTKVRTLLATAVLVVLSALFGAGVIATSASAEPSESDNHLTGTWNVTVNRPAPLPPLKSVQVFMSSGAMIEMANEPQATRTAQYGAWEPIRGRLYAASGLFYRFDPQGKFAGTTKINRTIQLGPDGNTIRYISRVSIYDASNHLVSSVVAKADGVRMPVERTSDVP